MQPHFFCTLIRNVPSFFKPVHFHLQPPNLLLKAGTLGFVLNRLSLPLAIEHLRQHLRLVYH